MVEEGADIYCRLIAEQLRALDKKEPGLILICKAQAPPKNRAARQPYFGCICTDAGRAYIRRYEAVGTDRRTRMDA